MRAWLRTEDGWAVLIGLALTALGTLPLLGVDPFGWVVIWIGLVISWLFFHGYLPTTPS